MLTPDDFEYAMENTRVVLSPQRRLETFGTTLLNYHLVTEEMDRVNCSRVREGRIEADKPQIVSPAHFSKLLLEGFGEKAQRFAEALSEYGGQMAILKYGFSVRKADIRTFEVHEPLEQVVSRVSEEVARKNDPLAAVVVGVDDGWEVCLLKFMFDMVAASGQGNIDDLRRRGRL
jgi:formate dehydrogenase maturation protein FdhE